MTNGPNGGQLVREGCYALLTATFIVGLKFLESLILQFPPSSSALAISYDLLIAAFC